MIKALIEIDKRARQTVQTAKDKRNEAKAEIAQEKSKVHEAYLKRANEHIEKMKQHADEETSQKQLTIEEGFRLHWKPNLSQTKKNGLTKSFAAANKSRCRCRTIELQKGGRAC